jgi:membrane-anchored glycerophosphoryl diester phosphodiesterase (GDPDase)
MPFVHVSLHFSKNAYFASDARVFSTYVFKYFRVCILITSCIYSVEITYGIKSVISKLMTFVENAETGQFLFFIMFILSLIHLSMTSSI